MTAFDPQTQPLSEACPACGEECHPGERCEHCHGVRLVCRICSEFFSQPAPKAGDSLTFTCRRCTPRKAA